MTIRLHFPIIIWVYVFVLKSKKKEMDHRFVFFLPSSYDRIIVSNIPIHNTRRIMYNLKI